MKLEELEVFPYLLPFSEPYATARGELLERELIVVRISGEGLAGLGETAALSLRGGAPIAQIADELQGLCRPALLELDFDPELIWSTLAHCRQRGASAPALAAVDIALHDLAGKMLGRPLWQLLGAHGARPVRCNATLPMANPTHLAAVARDWAAEGFSTFKLKVGAAGDLAQVTAVREALGPDPKLRLDANGAWSATEAPERLRAMARQTIELVEEPVSGLEQLAALRERMRIPIAADESVSSPREAREARELGACALATVKLAKVGGIAAALETAAELPVYLSSALEGPIGIAAAAHTAIALTGGPGDAGVAHGLATQRLFARWPGGSVAALEGDLLTVPEGPGLGVDLDPGELAGLRA